MGEQVVKVTTTVTESLLCDIHFIYELRFCTNYRLDGISSVSQMRKLRVFTVTCPWPHSDMSSHWYEYINLALLATQ